VKNAATKRLISGLCKPAQQTRQKPSSLNAQSAKTLGESIGKYVKKNFGSCNKR